MKESIKLSFELDKNLQLTELAKMFRVHFEQIILHDDGKDNGRAAQEVGAKACHTLNGLTPSLLSKVVDTHNLSYGPGQRARTGSEEWIKNMESKRRKEV